MRLVALFFPLLLGADSTPPIPPSQAKCTKVCGFVYHKHKSAYCCAMTKGDNLEILLCSSSEYSY